MALRPNNRANHKIDDYSFVDVLQWKKGGEIVSLGRTFKALGDETRREIIRLLKEKDLTAGEIALYFDITKPSISHHLGILKQANLITDERKGQNIIYSLNTSVMEEILGWAMEFTRTKGGNSNGKEAD